MTRGSGMLQHMAIALHGITTLGLRPESKSHEVALTHESWVLQPLQITLRGITNDGVDPSVDTWRAVTFPLMRHVTGVEGGFELKIMRRGAAPKVRQLKDPILCLMQRERGKA